MKKEEDSISLKRIKARIRKRNKKIMSNERIARLKRSGVYK